MKTLFDRAWTVMTAVLFVTIVGFFAPDLIWLDGNEVYAVQRDRQGYIELTCPDDCNKLAIYLDDFGYSDGLFYTHHAVPSHELLSGEWAAAILYDGIASAGPMWLTHSFVCPDWQTNSTFSVVQPMSPSGPNQVHSIIQNANDLLQIEIIATMVCSQTEMGISPDPAFGSYIASDSCILKQDYVITNLSPDSAIRNIYFYQFLHGHPGDRYDPVVKGVYDSYWGYDMNAAFPESEQYHYDITMWADITWNDTTYTEYVGFGCQRDPWSNYDLWHYRNPNLDNSGPYGCTGGKPADGLHLRVENDNLQGASSWGPDQTAGAQGWSLGDLLPQHACTVSVLLSAAAVERPSAIPTLTEWGMIVFCVLLFGWMAWVIVRRRRRVTTGV
jgi:hypothetical protein